ncbi:hypothetical protein NE850_38630 [Paraburkholderia sp. USG1]|uniref:hypothetical protein n=1 Tax=Paraburkholderia sp. USG1 TaxID=2952268 RepID=UPI002858B795|nr:hypothetical protein [Paraburkholderia sp. USG1]MDR8402237.1 hypothetical protein [Paraburkholderia sp. USG1]
MNRMCKQMKTFFVRLWYFQLPKMLRAYFRTRFLRVLGLWIAIFFAGWAINAAVQVLADAKLADTVKAANFPHFADAKLLVALGLGVMFVLFAHRLLKRTITISEADWGDDVVDAVMDEISAAATHYGSVLLVAWGAECLASFHFSLSDNLHLAFLSFGIAVYTFDAKANYRLFEKPAAGEYEAVLSYPEEGATFSPGGPAFFSGSMYKRPPRGYDAWLVRRWEKDAEQFHPVRKLDLSGPPNGPVSFDTSEQVWGQPGNNRYFELWLVGPQGKAVFEAWVKGNGRFVSLQGTRWDPRFSYPGLEATTDDMVVVFRSRRVDIVP